MANPKPSACDIYYSNCQYLNISCYVYLDNNLTVPLSNSYFSDGTYCYTTTATGQIDSKTTCPAPEYYTCDPIFGCIYDALGPYTSLAQCQSFCSGPQP